MPSSERPEEGDALESRGRAFQGNGICKGSVGPRAVGSSERARMKVWRQPGEGSEVVEVE